MTEKQKFQTVRICCLGVIGTVLSFAWGFLGACLVAIGIDKGLGFTLVSIVMFMAPTAYIAVVIFADAWIWFYDLEYAIFPNPQHFSPEMVEHLLGHPITKNRKLRNEDDD